MDHKTPFLLFNPPLQHSVMNKINPLDQPEIRLLIAEHLRGVDLVRCLRVCRSWHDTFLPFVWEKVSVGKVNWTQPSPSQDSLTPEVLRSHRHFIKALHILDSPGSCSFTFPQMQTMNFRPYNGRHCQVLDNLRKSRESETRARNISTRDHPPRLNVFPEYPEIEPDLCERYGRGRTVPFYLCMSEPGGLFMVQQPFDAQWTEEDACLIIEGMQRVKNISLGHTFGPLTFQALQRHFNSLVELHVELGNEVASELLQNILCSCPALKMLIGGGVPAKDVVEGKPWVCLSLEYLTISFMFSDREEHLQPLIFERLAKLKRLECIDSGAAITLVQGKHPVPLQFRLESGLDALSSLWRMVSLTTGYGNSLGEEELRWMMVHWKDLISVSGEVDIDSDTKIELEDLFKFRGIKLRR
ncbi:hypothetical protein EDD21DRAFT_349885 [Dissophora ornata]|nr:hypothetical protein EDD21DRAFT_349885 [Dissophora ornata]